MTVWDISESERIPVVDMQPSRVRAPKLLVVNVMAMAAGAIVCTVQAPLISHDPGCTSTNIISVQRVSRTESVPAARTRRRPREQYSPDATAGMSTRRLAEVSTRLFSPVEETGVDVDYSFG